MSNTSIGSFKTAHLFSNLKSETFLLNFNGNNACLLFLEALLVPFPEAIRRIFFLFFSSVLPDLYGNVDFHQNSRDEVLLASVFFSYHY